MVSCSMLQVKLAQIDINNPVSLGIQISTLTVFHSHYCVCMYVLEVNYFLFTCHR